jgi:hypothetical protein
VVVQPTGAPIGLAGDNVSIQTGYSSHDQSGMGIPAPFPPGKARWRSLKWMTNRNAVGGKGVMDCP